MAKVIYANACYTGGGIYQYNGKFDNGNYFLCFTDWEECMMELNADPEAEENREESGYDYWQEEHTVRTLPVMESYETLMDALNWILKNEPYGNYSMDDIECVINILKDDIKVFKSGKPNF
jgi:hypothetical protein